MIRVLAVLAALALAVFVYVGQRALKAKTTQIAPTVSKVLADPSGASTPVLARSGLAPSAGGGSASVASTAPSAVVARTGIGYGLSFALSADTTPALATLSCHGEPAVTDRPHDGSCNPASGDTSCRTVLPVACFNPTGAIAPEGLAKDGGAGWTSGQLGATQPVMGAILHSEKDATARCVAELGEGWRMAEFHAGGGWKLQGERGPGVRADTRYWVWVNDQHGNCWDSPP